MRHTLNPEIDLSQLENAVAQTDHVALNVNNYCRYTIPMLKKYHKDIWCDLGDFEINNPYFDDFATAATHITMSGLHVRNQKKLLEALIAQGKKLAVITNGSEGAIALRDTGDYLEVPAITGYPFVDANGAGDSFFSGLLYGRSKGLSVNKSLEIASIVAGLTISSIELFNKELCEELVASEYARIYGSPLSIP